MGTFTAKRAYLGPVLAERLGMLKWRSETHVLALAWTADVLHTLRLRTETFRSTAPDHPDLFTRWWRGDAVPPGITSTLVVLDPIAAGRQPMWVGLDDCLRARPRHHGYADLATALGSE